MPVANATMTVRCLIHGPDLKGVRDRVTNITPPPTPGPLKFSGAARVQRLNREQEQANAGQQVTIADYLIAIQFDANGIQPDDIVTIAQASDTDLTGRRLTVTGVMKGSLRWQRDLLAIDNLG